MKRVSIFLAFLFFLLATLFWGACSQQKRSPTDTATSGDVNICLDEAYEPIVGAQIYAFEALYKRANVYKRTVSDEEAIQLLLKDSCKVAILSRTLSGEEQDYFESKNIYPTSTKIAEDAIAIIINRQNEDSVFEVSQVKKMILGKLKTWNQLREGQRKTPINVVFDNPASATFRYMREVLLEDKTLGSNVFAVQSNREVVDYVAKNKGAVGIISINWISDKEDTLTKALLKNVKLAAISKDSSSKARRPYQSYIKTKEYPFCREVFAINRQRRAGLGTGFVSFLAGSQGQLIILKSGLVPAIAPTRMVKVNKK